MTHSKYIKDMMQTTPIERGQEERIRWIKKHPTGESPFAVLTDAEKQAAKLLAENNYTVIRYGSYAAANAAKWRWRRVCYILGIRQDIIISLHNHTLYIWMEGIFQRKKLNQDLRDYMERTAPIVEATEHVKSSVKLSIQKALDGVRVYTPPQATPSPTPKDAAIQKLRDMDAVNNKDLATAKVTPIQHKQMQDTINECVRFIAGIHPGPVSLTAAQILQDIGYRNEPVTKVDWNIMGEET